MLLILQVITSQIFLGDTISQHTFVSSGSYNLSYPLFLECSLSLKSRNYAGGGLVWGLAPSDYLFPYFDWFWFALMITVYCKENAYDLYILYTNIQIYLLFLNKLTLYVNIKVKIYNIVSNYTSLVKGCYTFLQGPWPHWPQLVGLVSNTRH